MEHSLPTAEPSFLALSVLIVVGILALIGLKTVLHTGISNNVRWVLGGLAVLGLFAMVGLYYARTAARSHVFASQRIAEIREATGPSTVISRRRVNPPNPSWEEVRRIDLSQEGDDQDDDSQSAGESSDASSSDSVRPEWVDQPDRHVGQVTQQRLTAGPWQDVDDCYREMEEKLKVAVHKRVEWLTSNQPQPHKVRVPPIEALGLGVDYVLRELCKDEYVETVSTESFENLKNLHVLMEFSASDDALLLDRWETYIEGFEERRRTDRLAGVALASSMVVAVLGLAYGLLRIDTWTRGYYTKRLLLGVPAAILVVVVFAVLAN